MDYRVLGLDGEQRRKFAPVDDALKKGGCKGSLAITWGLVDLNAKFDIFILPADVLNGSFNSITDKGGEGGNVAYQNYVTAGFKWLERPTIFWNPNCSVKIYSDVTGVNDADGVVGFKRATPDTIKADQRTLIYLGKMGKAYGAGVARRPSKVVITATEIVLPPWVVLMHELGHAKQYFEFVRRLNRPAHSEAVESAWGAFALSPGSSEPDNVGRHEKPITQFHLHGYRQRYYHDAFHFGMPPDGKAYAGWGSRSDLNYDASLDSTHDNFIFTNPAKRLMFDTRAASLPVYNPKIDEGEGYYRSC